MQLTEDIDEMLSEYDDESLYAGELPEDDYAERRKKRGRGLPVRGRGYAQPRVDASPVKHTEMQGALARVAADVRKLAENQKALDDRMGLGLKKLRTDTQQSAMMAAMIPLLFKPKTKTQAELTATDKIMVDEGDALTMMLPLLMMSGMGGSSSGTGTGMDNSMMMMAVALMAASPNK